LLSNGLQVFLNCKFRKILRIPFFKTHSKSHLKQRKYLVGKKIATIPLRTPVSAYYYLFRISNLGQAVVAMTYHLKTFLKVSACNLLTPDSAKTAHK